MEQSKLEEFRSRVCDFVPDNLVNDDTFLLRWLVAREFNIGKAEKMLKNYLEWRTANDIDSIIQWIPPADLVTACPYTISVDNGRPILIFPYGKWTPWTFIDSGRRDEYLKYMNQMLEKCALAIQPPATQFIIIADSEGFGLRQMANVKAIDANLEALKGFENHYPELMSVAYAINAPKVFSMLYALIKPLMSQRTQAKLQVYDCNKTKWATALARNISEDKLPIKYTLLDCNNETTKKRQNESIDEHRPTIDVVSS